MPHTNSKYGYIIAVDTGLMRVRIASDAENCGACSIAAMCGKGMVVELPYANTANHSLVGKKIKITFAPSLPVWLGVVMPIAILIGVPVSLLLLGVDQIWCVGGAAGALALWYVFTHIIYKERSKVVSWEFVEPFPSESRYSGELKNTD